MRVDGLGLPQLINIKGLSDILGKLLVGDKFEVQIVKIDGNELTLRLPNGQNVSATTVAPLELTLGDFLDLSVKSKSDNQIVLQTLTDTNEQTKFQDVGDTLASLKLPPDERNFEIGTALINQHLPLNADNFKAVMNVLGMFEGIDIEKAVFIVANNIQSIPEGKELLDKFENSEASVGKSISKLIGLLASNVDGHNLDKIFSDFKGTVVSKSIEDNNKEIQNIINNYSGFEEEDKNIIKLFIKQSIVQSNNAQSTVESLLGHKISVNSLEYLLESEDNQELFKFISQNPLLEEKLINFLNDKGPLDKFILEFSKENPAIFKRYSNLNSASTTDNVKSFFKDIINNIKGERIKKEIDVNKLYKDIEVKLDVLENHIDKYNITNGDKIRHVIGEIRSETSFIKNIDNMFNFYQLPFIINQNNTTVDMYILKNSREHRKIDPDNTTIFLSLNTQNLGQVEILIHLQDKIVNFNFRLEDDKTINFFERRQDMLEDILSNKGYNAGKVKYALSSKKTNIVNFEHTVRADRNTVKDVFDMKV